MDPLGVVWAARQPEGTIRISAGARRPNDGPYADYSQKQMARDLRWTGVEADAHICQSGGADCIIGGFTIVPGKSSDSKTVSDRSGGTYVFALRNALGDVSYRLKTKVGAAVLYHPGDCRHHFGAKWVIFWRASI
jgi:hypothetical protein